jgi:curved DNA-binding protein CbpA
VANPEDLDKLCQGPKVWNVWRAENSERVPDLRGARLTLSQRQFGVNHGGPVDLNRCDLESAELRHANLVGANLQYARLVAADLVHAQLDNADLAGADLTDAVLDYADLTDADLEGAILVGASLANARGLTQEQIADAHGDASTVLPAMLLPPASWYPPLDEDMFGGSLAPESIHYSDPYEVLRVWPTATQDEIRAAFRNLVKLYHPDINPGDSEAQEVFKRISIAYRILGDADKRARYDRGEIGGDGEASPEYEAKQHFRRHAFRIYAAAAASLVVAIGALATVWYVVLTNEGVDERRVRIAVAGPPKQEERLQSPGFFLPSEATKQLEAKRVDPDAEAFLNAQDEPAETTVTELKVEEPPASPVETAQVVEDKAADDQAAPTAEEQSEARAETETAEAQVPPTENITPTAAAADTPVPSTPSPAESQQVANLPEPQEPVAPKPEPAAIGGEPSVAEQVDAAVPAEGQPPASGAVTPPLGEQHSAIEARPAQADAARSVAPVESESVKTGSIPAAVGQGRSVVAKAGPGYSPHSDLLRNTMGRKIGTDPVAAMLWAIVTETKAAPKRDQTTGSLRPLLARGDGDDGEEVFDLYRHSLPEPSADKDRERQGLVKAGDRSLERGAGSQERTAVSVPAEMRTGSATPPEPSPGAAFRERAITDVLAGGL